jgi:4-coumarate--CoA ligase
MASRVQAVDTKLLITDSSSYPMAKEVARLCGDIKVISIDNVPGIPCMQHLITGGDPTFNDFHLDTPEEAEVHTAMIFRTSGSTGAIKSVLMPHLHWNVNTLTTALTAPDSTDGDKDTWIATLPFAYGITAKLYMGLNLLLGIPVVIPLHPFDRTSLSLIDHYNITFLFVTPPLAADLAKSEVQGSFRSIKWLLSAGAPIHSKIREAIQEKFNGTRLALEWASTETLLIALQLDGVPYPTGSSGCLVNGMEARVIDLEDGSELGPGEQGELLVRNKMCKFAGYKNNAKANGDFDSEGWYHSGDVGFIDEDSNVFIVDRVKQFLRVGDGYGTHLAPGELEACLFDHPAVGSAIVMGMRDADTQLEHPAAFVVLHEDVPRKTDAGHRALAAELERYVEERLGSFKRISGGVYFVRDYPTTGFKVNRRALASLVDIKSPVPERLRLIGTIDA